MQTPSAVQGAPSGQLPQEPPQPSSPQLRPSQLGWHAQACSSSQIRPAAQLPQAPPQPSSPHAAAVQSGTQPLGSHSPLDALHSSSAAHLPSQAASSTWLPDSENPSVRPVTVSLEQLEMAAINPTRASLNDVDRAISVSATMQLLLWPARDAGEESVDEDESVNEA